MKRFLTFTGLGFGLITGGWLAYSFTYSESVRLVVSVLGAILLTATLLLTTAWIVASSMSRAYGNRRDQYQFRYDQRPQFPGQQQYYPGLPPGQDFYQTGQPYQQPAVIEWDDRGGQTEEVVG